MHPILKNERYTQATLTIKFCNALIGKFKINVLVGLLLTVCDVIFKTYRQFQHSVLSLLHKLFKNDTRF